MYRSKQLVRIISNQTDTLNCASMRLEMFEHFKDKEHTRASAQRMIMRADWKDGTVHNYKSWVSSLSILRMMVRYRERKQKQARHPRGLKKRRREDSEKEKKGKVDQTR